MRKLYKNWFLVGRLTGGGRARKLEFELEIFEMGRFAGWLVGAGVIGALLLGVPIEKAAALTQAEILQKLKPVLVFTVVDKTNQPLLVRPPDGESGALTAGVFIAPEDAEQFINNFKAKDAERGNQLRVLPVSLANLYMLQQQSRSQPQEVQLALIPSRDQVSWAQTLLLTSGRKVGDLQGTPIFVAVLGKQKKYLTLKQDEGTVVPFYLAKADLLAFIELYRREQKDPNAPIGIEVLSLEEMLQSLEERNDTKLNQIRLIAPKASFDYLEAKGTAKAAPAAPAPVTPPAAAAPAASAPPAPAPPAAAPKAPPTSASEGLAPTPPADP